MGRGHSCQIRTGTSLQDIVKGGILAKEPTEVMKEAWGLCILDAKLKEAQRAAQEQAASLLQDRK